jgi:hypothetical protein
MKRILLSMVTGFSLAISYGQNPISYNPNNNSASVSLSWKDNISRIRYGGSGLGAYNGFQIQGPGDQVKFTVLHNGNIGIGTTNPGSYKLYVNGNSYVNGSLTFPAVADDGTKSRTHLSFPVKTDGFYISTQQLSRDKMEVLFKLRDNTTGDSFRMWFDDYRGAEHDRNPFIVYGDRVLLASDGGNVGIGTNSPNALLDVEGNRGELIRLTYDNTAGYVRGFKSGQKHWYVGAGGSVDDVHFANYRNARLHLMTNSQYRLSIGGNGNVGIGITNPTHKLTVNGVISATEVKVSTTPNSDFVFEPEYQLRPLEEVDAFIRENKHLPDIPSAAEFKENGVGLGEMDNMLLQKIEELTLYVIELKKENEELKADNIAIKDGLLKELETIKAQLR